MIVTPSRVSIYHLESAKLHLSGTVDTVHAIKVVNNITHKQSDEKYIENVLGSHKSVTVLND